MPIDRRRFLKGAGAVAAVGATGVPLGCGSSQVGPDGITPGGPLTGMPLGAVFDVDTTRALVWIGGPAQGEAEVTATDPAGAIVASGLTRLDAAGTGALELVGLRPGTVHAVTIRLVDGLTAAPYQFTTAPADTDPRPVRLAWSADLDLDPEFASPILDTVIAQAPDVFVSLGDWPYADNAPGAMTLDEYRSRHQIARTDPGTQRLLRALSVRAIYDDHEVRNDWDAGTEANEPDRHLAGMQAWDEYFPVRAETAAVRYRRWRWGAHVEAFLLDTRRYRASKLAPDGPDKTMLGAAQRTWLIDGLAASTARWKLVFTTVPLDYGTTDDHWPAYRAERDLIFAELVTRNVAGVLFLSADQHWFASHRHAYNIRELQAGPLARGFLTPPAPVPEVLVRIRDYNVGVLDIDAETIRARCVDAAGAVRYEELFSVDELTPR